MLMDSPVSLPLDGPFFADFEDSTKTFTSFFCVHNINLGIFHSECMIKTHEWIRYSNFRETPDRSKLHVKPVIFVIPTESMRHGGIILVQCSNSFVMLVGTALGS